MRLEDLISKHYEQLNENDLLIWDYIAKHKKACENMSIDELGNKCHVSRSTVLRFAKRLGLKGYAELKVHLRIDNQMASKTRIDEELYSHYQREIEQYHQYNFDEVVKTIYHAKNVFVLGTGDIQMLASQYAKIVFAQENKLFLEMNGYDDYEAYIHMFEKDDIFLAVSYGGENKKLVDFIYRLKAKGVCIVGIVGVDDCTVARISDHCFKIQVFSYITSTGRRANILTSYQSLIEFMYIHYVAYCKIKAAK